MKKLKHLLNVCLFFFGSFLAMNQKQCLKSNESYKSQFLKMWQLGGNLIVQFKSNTNFDFTQENKIQLAAHLPGFKEIDSSKRKPDLIIEHTYGESDIIQLVQDEGKIFIQSQWQKLVPADFIHFLYGACRLEWIKRGIFPVHAACIGNDEEGYVLLMGPPGSGKTSLTLYNAFNNDLKIFSGDKTLITFNQEGQMEAIAGTESLTIRIDDMPRWLHIKKIDENVFGDRLTFQLPSDYYTRKPKVIIKQIFFITVKDEAFEGAQLTSLSALHRLYPFFLDKQREDILIGGNQTFLDGTIKKKIKNELINHLFDSLQQVTAYTLSGSLEEMSSFVQEKSGYPVYDKGIGQKKILFGICGIGNGHLNRQLPIIRSLLEKKHKIMIFTYGEGLTFFDGKLSAYSDVTIVPVANPYFVGTPEGIDFKQTACSDKNDIDFNRINSLAMYKATKEFGKPDLIISDYEMVSAQYAYARQASLITLDQQSKYLVGDFIPDLNGTSYKDEIERLSMFFPKATKRIAVSFFKVTENILKNDFVVEINPPILRPEIIAAKGTAQSKESSILVYVTAQQLGEQPVDRWIATIKAVLPKDVVAHIFLPRRLTLPENNTNLHFYHHGDSRFDSLLFTCHGIITTAGHTLLSEAMYLEKPVYALPLPLYEQQLNALIIKEGGFGISQEDLTETGLDTFITNLKSYKNNIHNDKKFLLKGVGNDSVMHTINALLRNS